MMSLTHASAGALAGEFIPNPYLAFLAGVVIHFIMDKIPHFWPKTKKNKDIQIAIDTALSALFILGLFLYPATRSASMIAGAIGGVSVDLYFVLIKRGKGKLAEWHTNRQYHHAEPIWILTDVSLFACLVALMWLTIR
jgi:hypothetical protein